MNYPSIAATPRGAGTRRHDRRIRPVTARPSRDNDGLQALRATALARHQQRLATRLAARLALVHGIRLHETALAPWLTDAHCATNGAALAQWVLRQLSDVAAVLPQDESARFNTLSQRLARLLADLTETQPW